MIRIGRNRRADAACTPRAPGLGRGRVVRPRLEYLEARNLLSASAAADIVQASAAASVAPARGDWTVMVYMTATDLAPFAPPNIEQMERLATTLPGSVRFVVLYDQWANRDANGDRDTSYTGPAQFNYATGNGSQPAWTTSGIGLVQPDAHSAELDANGKPNIVGGNQVPSRIATTFQISTSEVNTADPSVLSGFIVEAAQIAPANHYALVLWDHGAGIEALNSDSFDVLPSDSLTSAKVVGALTMARAGGVSLDLLAFDECLMATTESVYSVRSLVPVVVASEELVAGGGYNYTTAFGVLAHDPANVNARALAASLVSSFQTTYAGGDESDTLSATDSAAVDGLADALKTFVVSTVDARPSDWAGLRQARADAPSFDGAKGVYRDLGQFLSGASTSKVSQRIRDAAGVALGALRAAVLSNTANSRGAQGLSIYLPATAAAISRDYIDQANSTGFLDRTGWLGFLRRFTAAPGAKDVPSSVNWAGNQRGPASAEDLGILAGRKQRVPALTISGGQTNWFRFTLDSPGVRGHVIQLANAAGRKNLVLNVVDAGAPGRVLASGTSSVNLKGLPAGTYLLSVSAARNAAPSSYGLAILAPPQRHVAPPLNVSAATARDLGSVLGAKLVTGQDRGNAAGEGWYSFRTPRSEDPLAGKVTILGEGQPLILTILDEHGRVLGNGRGRGTVQASFTAGGGGETYYLKVQARGAFGIYFGGLS
jgi:hypothetical protein